MTVGFFAKAWKWALVGDPEKSGQITVLAWRLFYMLK